MDNKLPHGPHPVGGLNLKGDAMSKRELKERIRRIEKEICELRLIYELDDGDLLLAVNRTKIMGKGFPSAYEGLTKDEIVDRMSIGAVDGQ